MTILCIGEDCGAAYIQGYPGPIFDDNLIAAGWEHTPAGWLCAECAVPNPLCTCPCHVGEPPCSRCFERQCPIVEALEPSPGLCPVCGAYVTLAGETTDGRLIGTCGDAFSRRKWEEED